MPEYDEEGDVIYPACVGCQEYELAATEGFCETGFAGNCKRRRNAKDTNA